MRTYLLIFLFLLSSQSVRAQNNREITLLAGVDTQRIGHALAEGFKKAHSDIAINVLLDKKESALSVLPSPPDVNSDTRRKIKIGKQTNLQLNYAGNDENIYAFINWVLEDGQHIIKKSGMLPLDDLELKNQKHIIQTEMNNHPTRSCDGIDALNKSRRQTAKKELKKL